MKIFTNLEKKFLIFFSDYAKMVLDSGYKAKQDEPKEHDLKY